MKDKHSPISLVIKPINPMVGKNPGQMETLLSLLLLIPLLTTSEQTLIIDFGKTPGKNQEWILISDNIMGESPTLNWSIPTTQFC